MRILKRVLFWLTWPALYVYLRSGSRSRILLVDADKVLLVRGRWSWLYGDSRYELPGGGIKRKEDPKRAAQRELYEELGLEIELNKIRPLGISVIRGRGLRYTAQLFVAPVSQAITLHLQKSEIKQAEWVAATQLATMSVKPEVSRAVQAWSNTGDLLQ